MLARGARTLLARNLPVLQSQTRGLLVRKGKRAQPAEDSRALVKSGNDAWVAVKDKETGAPGQRVFPGAATDVPPHAPQA